MSLLKKLNYYVGYNLIMKNIEINFNHVVCFTIDSQKYALPLNHVERVLRMVAVSPVPDAPLWFIGMIDLQGRVISVMDIRKRFNFSIRNPLPTDRLIVIKSKKQTFAITCDEVTSVMEVSGSDMNKATDSFDNNIPISYVIRKDSGMIMVLDIKRLIVNYEQ